MSRLARPGEAAITATLRTALAEGLLTPEEPAVVFHDLDLLAARFAALAGAFPATTLHAVAIKANPIVGLLRRVVALGGGLEAASIEEVALALAAGCAPDKIVYDSPAKSLPDLRFALTHGITINADNLDELDRIGALLTEIDSLSQIGVRVNPLVGEGLIQATSVTGPRSQFGVMLAEPERSRLTAAFARYPWLTGLHVHVGSQGCSLDQLVAGVQRAMAFRDDVHAALNRPAIRVVDIGGGLPTAYRDTDRPPSADAYAAALREAVPELFSPDLRIVTEFGRFLQAGCGWAASRVEYAKHQGGRAIAVLHLGADFLLRRAYRPQDWHHDFLVFDADGRPKADQGRSPWTLAGPLCFSGDILADDLPLPPLESGDLVVIRDVGAYAMGMWSRHCSRSMPAVIGYAGTAPVRLETLLRRERPADVVAFWEGRR